MTTDRVADLLWVADQEESLLRAPWPLRRAARSPPCKSGDHELCLGTFTSDPRPGIHRGIVRCECLCHS